MNIKKGGTALVVTSVGFIDRDEHSGHFSLDGNNAVAGIHVYFSCKSMNDMECRAPEHDA